MEHKGGVRSTRLGNVLAVVLVAAIAAAFALSLSLLWRGYGGRAEKWWASRRQSHPPATATATPFSATPPTPPAAATPVPVRAPSVTVQPTRVAPGGRLVARFDAIGRPRPHDWVSVYRAGAPDTSYGEWRYLNGQTSGEAELNAPAEPGIYEVRLLLDWPNGGYRSVARSEPVVVGSPAPTPPGPSKASLRLAEAVYAPGEAIRVAFAAPAGYPPNAWVGVVPASVPHGDEATNDAADVMYQYLSGRTSGELTFTAPTTVGAWDLRMHDTDSGGKEVASVGFAVSRATIDLSGTWRGDDGFTYTIRQVVDQLWWRAEPHRGGAGWPSVAHGTVTSRTATVEWVELPTGPAYWRWVEQPPGARALESGVLQLDAASDGRIVVRGKPAGCRLTSLTRLP